MVLGLPAENGPFKMRSQNPSSDFPAVFEPKRWEEKIDLRPVFVSIAFIASSRESGVKCT